MSRSAVWVALAALGCADAAALSWQDCGLLADVRGLELLSYSHEPDPIVLGEAYTITRHFRTLLPIQNLTEQFWSYERNGTEWSFVFGNGPFSRCGAADFQSRCPLPAGAELRFRERHPGTAAARPGRHRAVEHYFSDGVFAGCVVAVYDYRAPDYRAPDVHVVL
ncbi:unnamed protein product [Effrenium voratum]|nr:unnamed protein product [Effrenium voratum]